MTSRHLAPDGGFGDLLFVLAVVTFLSTLVVGAALASPVAHDPPGERVTVVGSQGGGPFWHRYGSVSRIEGTDVAWREGSAASYFDVTWADDDAVVAAFVDDGYAACGPYEPPCARTGVRVVDPTPVPRVREVYSFPVRTTTDSEVHDAEPLPGGGYLVADMEHERIVVVEGGTVVWRWNASSFYDAPADPTAVDWLHVNDVDRIGAGRYLVSVRNANQLLVVERGEGVVTVVNADRDDGDDGACTRRGELRDTDGDGDVRCGDPAVLSHQHNPQWLGDGAVLVADSDNDRVVELHRSAGGVWRPAWVLRGTGGVAFRWPRDADRLPGGTTLITDTGNRRVVEVDGTGAVVWSVRTRRMPYEADRVPAGEPVGAPTAEPGRPSTGSRPSPLAPAVIELRAVTPWLPHWYGEVEFGMTLVSLGVGALGVLIRRRE